MRDLEELERSLVLDCWGELWAGTLCSQRQLKTLEFEVTGDGALIWRISPLVARA